MDADFIQFYNMRPQGNYCPTDEHLNAYICLCTNKQTKGLLFIVQNITQTLLTRWRPWKPRNIAHNRKSN